MLQDIFATRLLLSPFTDLLQFPYIELRSAGVKSAAILVFHSRD